MSSSTKTEPIRQLPHLHGHFYYTDLHTSDLDGATAFYSKLFGWSTMEAPGAEPAYRMAMVDDRVKAGMTEADSIERGGDWPAHWFCYLTVDDIDAAYARVTELGGTTFSEVTDMMGQGRMALVADPTGAAFGLWEDSKDGQTTVMNEHGSPFWYESHTTDVDKAMPFYEELVGWKRQANPMGPEMTYYVMEAPEHNDGWQMAGGGMMQQMRDMSDMGAPSVWSVYFNVDDTDKSAALAIELGATYVMEPHDIPTVGRACVLRDPQGAVFTIMKPIPPQRD